jgi:exopolysaccharide biosynthesis protein
VSILFLLVQVALAEFPTSQPFRAVSYAHEKRTGLYMSLYVVRVDLTDPRVKMRIVSAGEDPDGSGPWRTTLMTVREIAERERFDVAINASFFSIPTTQQAPQLPAGYVKGKPASPVRHSTWPVLWIDVQGKAQLGDSKAAPRDAKQLVAGSCYVLKDGKPATPFAGAMLVRHPRTVIGLDRDGTQLVLLTVDGRRPGVSLGMTGEELASELLRLGCFTAINLDGGGSTTLVMRDPTSGECKVINQPAANAQRPVADVVGINISQN